MLGTSTSTQTDSILQDETQAKIDQVESFYKELEKKTSRAKEREKSITRLVNYLRSQGSPVANRKLAEQIISTSERSGGDYKMIVAIAGVESGFCRANYKKYNCFGYLNNVQYSSFEMAFAALIPKISREYVRVYGTNFKAFAKAYGIRSVDAKSELLAKYYNSL